MGFRNLKAILFVFFLFLPQVASAAGWQWMPPQRAFSLIKEGSGLWLVDVRSGGAFEEGHIEGAVHIPAGILATKRLPKGKIIVLADDALGLKGARESAEVLLKNGQDKVYLLEGGIPAWQAEGYPLAGKGSGRTFRGVMPDEIRWAQENRIPLKILDLRDEGERSQGPVAEAMAVEGAGVAERLQKVKGMLTQKKGLAAMLEKSATVILIFPATAETRPMLERSFREIPGDVRYLEGGYAVWAAKPDKSMSTVGTCPTCPGGGSK